MESHVVNVTMLFGAAVVLAFVLYGHLLESRAFLTAPMLCLAAGIAVGPAGLSLVDFDMSRSPDREIVYHLARVVIALTVMNAALQLSDGFLQRRWRSMLVILAGGMTLMWLASSAVMLLFGTGLALALLLGAIVTPTDPVLSGAIVSGRIAAANVPRRIRDVIVAESAANDGLAIAFVMLPILVLTAAAGEGAPWREWVLEVIVREVIGAGVIGYALGYAAGRAYAFARANQALQTKALVPFLAALAISVLGAVKLLGGTGLLGAFVAGIALKPFLKNEAEKSVEHFEAVTERLVTPLFIVLIGILLPFGQWQEIGPVLLAAVGGILLLRRLPAFLLLSPAIPALRDVDERVFVGWFGPIGVSAASYAALASGHVDDPLLWPVTSAVVTGSIVVHGLSATPLGRRLGRHEERARTREGDARGAA